MLYQKEAKYWKNLIIKIRLNFYLFQFEVFFPLRTSIYTEHSPYPSSYSNLSFSMLKRWLVGYTFTNFYASCFLLLQFLLAFILFRESLQAKQHQSLQVFEDTLPAIFFFAPSFFLLYLYRELNDIHGWKTSCCHPLRFLNKKHITYGLFAKYLFSLVMKIFDISMFQSLSCGITLVWIES